ncbi:MAG TPA: threonine-phosphate decarboxylase [Leucothrix mucor]|uniref:threonine-phosphate decarboxylase n=1 Tax=Leucothrix mucor TaxID=45248 RepID=A0A7V2T1K6_LEUMU|nr:threonine-phosphate decarboxylase [Leucothrix mucor]
MKSNQKITHGGNLHQASELYTIPLKNWIDLSTGINPRPWLPPDIPTSVWQRLPETDDDLLPVAQHYYGCDTILPIAGSQFAIQSLPYCRQRSRIGIVSPCYAEHVYWWEQAGHSVVTIRADEIDLFIRGLDVLLLSNPNNPDTTQYASDDLLRWHQQLIKDKGWLIVDEAFVDSTPEASLLSHFKRIPNGLIVLRSIGKFFGLAGIRLGFIAAEADLLEKIAQQQGPWAVSHPARWLGSQALADQQWHQQTCEFLINQSTILKNILSQYFSQIYKTNYFCYFQHPDAKLIKHKLAQQGIWIRHFEEPSSVRLGLPASHTEFHRLRETLSLCFASIS